MLKKAVILFSGGLDSTTCLAIAKSEGFQCYALTFDYGQKHSGEIEAATRMIKTFNISEHKIISLALHELGGSALTDKNIPVKDYNDDKSIPVTYVPARNTVFLSIALGWAEIIGAHDIFIGANDLDYSGYPDCRPDYFRVFESMANLATKAGIEGARFKINAPLLQMKKYEIIHKGLSLGVDYSLTVSCYRLNEKRLACGRCDSCTYRKKGFLEAGIKDPTQYYS